MKRTNFLESTYSLFSSSLVGFDFKLQFVHQVLQTQGILPIFLSLRTQIGNSLVNLRINIINERNF